jgi:hypothetical protein
MKIDYDKLIIGLESLDKNDLLKDSNIEYIFNLVDSIAGELEEHGKIIVEID